MINNEYLVSRFDKAVMLLPQELRKSLCALTSVQKAQTEEIRLRVGFPLTVVCDGVETAVCQALINTAHIMSLLEIATLASPYSAADAMNSGYITARGGFRIGLGGSVATENGRICSWRGFSSAAIRISREIIGCADEVLKSLSSLGRSGSLLVISPPGCGKTTLLRDIVRQLSGGNAALGIIGKRVGLCDERSEIAAMYSGRAQFDLGCRTDIIDACPKAEAAIMLLRGMNPEIIVMDEVTAPEDVCAIEKSANCGVGIIATAHAGGIGDLSSRPLYLRLLNTGVFSGVVIISRAGERREYKVVSL